MSGARLPSAAPVGSGRRLVWLTAAVLAAHLLLLLGWPALPTWHPKSPNARPMLTRTLPAPPEAVPVPAVAQVAAAPARPRARPRRAAPAAVPPPAPPTPAAPAEQAEPQAAPAGDETVAAAPAAEAASAPEAVAPPKPAASAAAASDRLLLGPVAVPGPATLQYRAEAQVSGLTYHASGELQWRPAGAQYEATLTLSVLFNTRVQTSSGRITPQGLAPTRFADRTRRGEQAAHFDGVHQRITFSANTPDAPLLPGMQDRLSLFLQLSALIAGQPAHFPPGTQLTIPTAGPRDTDPSVLNVEHEETLELAGQTLPTLKLRRDARHEHDNRVELWLASTLDYLPVRIRITQTNGDYVDMTLDSLERR